MSNLQIKTEAADTPRDNHTQNQYIELYRGTTLDENIIWQDGFNPKHCVDIVNELRDNIGTCVIPLEIENQILIQCNRIDNKYKPVPISLTDDFEQASGYAKNALLYSGGKGGSEILNLARERICTEDAFKEFRDEYHPDCRIDDEIKSSDKKAIAKVVVMEIPIMELDPQWRRHFEWVHSLEERRGHKIQTPTAVSGVDFTKNIPPKWVKKIINLPLEE